MCQITVEPCCQYFKHLTRNCTIVIDPCYFRLVPMYGYSYYCNITMAYHHDILEPDNYIICTIIIVMFYFQAHKIS